MAKTTQPRADFPGQHEDEHVEYVFRQHSIVLRKILLVSLVIFALGSLPLNFWPARPWSLRVLITGTLLAAAVFMYRWLSWYFSVYILTDERLIQIKQRGFFNRQVVDISLSRIQSVNYEIKGFQATLFRFGTIIVQTYVGDLILDAIPNPVDVHRMLVKIIRTIEPVDPSESDHPLENTKGTV